MIIVGTLHPAALLRGRDSDTGLSKFEDTVRDDIGKALRLSRERPRWDERVIWERDSVGRLKNLFPTPEEVIEFCRNALGHPVATDSETTGEQVMSAQLMCAGYASANGTAICVPFLKRGGSKYWAPHDEQRVRWAVGQLHASRDTLKILHNKEFDKIVYWLNGLPVAGPEFDTMQAHHVIDSELPHALGYCMTRYLDARYHKDDVKGDEGWLYLDDAQLRSYNLRDCIGTRELMPIFSNELTLLGPKLWALYEQECKLTALMARATVRGLAVDFWRRDCETLSIPVYGKDGKSIVGYKKGLGPSLRDQMNGALMTLKQLAGTNLFDPMKPAQLKGLLFDRLRFPIVKMSESGLHPSTDKEAMVLLALAAGSAEQKACIKALADFKQGQKFLSTFVEGLKVTGDGRFHPTWKLLTTTGRFASSPNCFDRETEILTPAGWVKGFDLNPESRVAQWRDGRIEFVQPTELIFTDTQSLVHIEGTQHIDLAVTPEHRCLLRHRKTGVLRVFSGADYPEDWQQLQAGMYHGPGLPYSLDELRLAIAIQADGNTSYLKRGRLLVGFSKARKVERYEALLTRLGATFVKKEQFNLPDRPYRCWFTVNAGDLSAKVQTLLGPEKKFGAWVLQLNREQLDVFVEELWHWDGCFTRKNHYSSSVKSNTEWAQIACALSGLRTGLREYLTPKGRSNWQTDVTRKDCSLTTNVQKLIVQGRAPVWCVSVPSSFVVVRRNGRIAVTGNCQNWRANVKAIFCAGNPRFSPDQPSDEEFSGSDLEQAEMRGIAYDSNDPRLGQMYQQNLNVHTVNLAMSLKVRPPIGHKDLDPATEAYIRQQLPMLFPGWDFSRLMEMDGKALKGARTLIKNDGFGRNYGGEDEVVFGILRAARDPDSNELLFPTLKRSDVEANGVLWKKLNVYIIKWWGKKLADAKAKGYYQCPISGRIRWFRAGQKKNDVLGTPIQMMVASFMNERMLEVQDIYDRETGGQALIVQQVHDSMNAANPKAYSPRAAQVMTQVLSRPIALPGFPNATFPPGKVLHGSHLDQV